MRTLKLFLALTLASVLLAPVVNAQTDFAGGVTAGDDADVALLIRYIGTGHGITPATTGAAVGATTLTFTESGVVDATIGTAGVIDISAAAYDTLDEICDLVNADTDQHWRCIVGPDALGSDYAYATDKKLLTVAVSSALIEGGQVIHWDTSTLLHASRGLVPFAARKIEFYLNGTALKPNPFLGLQMSLIYTDSIESTCTAAGFLYYYQVLQKNGTTSSAETVDTVAQISTGTTATVIAKDYTGHPITFDPNRKVVIRRSCTTATVNAQVVVLGESKVVR